MSWRIKLHRKIQDNPISSSLEIMWLLSSFLLKANHKEKIFYIWLEKITIWPWQFVSSMSKLADEYEVSKTKIYRMVERLKMERILKHEWNNKYSLFTIINRNKYQWDETQNETQQERQRYTNNNDKEWKEYNLLSIIETWNKIKWFKSTRKITNEIKTQRNKVMKNYTIEDFELAVNNYYEDTLSRTKTNDPKWYDKHRFTFYEFIKQDNWLQKWINK